MAYRPEKVGSWGTRDEVDATQHKPIFVALLPHVFVASGVSRSPPRCAGYHSKKPGVWVNYYGQGTIIMFIVTSRYMCRDGIPVDIRSIEVGVEVSARGVQEQAGSIE